MEANAGKESLPEFGSQVLSDICDLPELDEGAGDILDPDCDWTPADDILWRKEQQRQADCDPAACSDNSAISCEFEPEEKHPVFYLAMAGQHTAVRKARSRRSKPRKLIKFKLLPLSRPKNMYSLPRQSVQILESWITQHSDHPYPSLLEREELIAQTGLTVKQIQNWLSITRYKRGIQKPHKKH